MKYDNIRLKDNILFFESYISPKNSNKFKLNDRIKVKIGYGQEIEMIGNISFVYSKMYEIDFGENDYVRFHK